MRIEPIKANKFIKDRCFALPTDEVIDKTDALEAVRIAFKEGQQNSQIKKLEWDNMNNASMSYLNFNITELKHFNPSLFIIKINGSLCGAYESLKGAKEKAQIHLEAVVRDFLIIKDI